MGYTHYWNNTKPFTPDFLADVRAVIRCTDVPLLREYNQPGTKPEIGDSLVAFNGVGENGHETFCMRPGEEFDFCKTQCKPYDVAVVAILALAADHGLAIVSSDGCRDEWGQGVALACRATGRKVSNPITEG